MSGTVTSGRHPLPVSIYRDRLRRLQGELRGLPKREHDRLRQQRHRARLALQRARESR